MKFEAVIGLEVHAELLTRTKIFCGCPAEFGGEPNSHVCPICAGMPGVLPVLNQQVLEFANAVPLYDVQITVLTAFPGTPLYDRLLREGRILKPDRWDLCTLFDVNHQPGGMTVEELRQGMRWLTRRLYSAEAT